MTEEALKPAHRESGSFRDPASAVFYVEGRIRRGLSASGLADWDVIAGSPAFTTAVADGRVIGTRLIDRRQDSSEGDWAAILAHDRIPFISYPYEWTFGMLKDAALLQLELLEDALDSDLILKDATPYNVQFRGAHPIFIDVGSYTRHREGEPWVGYRQFCMQFLYPLMLEAFRGVPFQPWLRGSLEGLTSADMARLLSRRDRLRRGVLSHVVLHSRLEYSQAARASETRRELRSAGFNTELIRANVRKLRKLVHRLDRPEANSMWARYGETKTYTDAEVERKDAFVRSVADRVRPRLAWDLGCNDARYSRIVAEGGAEQVVAVDSDPATVDMVYRDLRREGDERVLPLTIDLTDPSPARGWRNRERMTLPERGMPELVLCLALVHHLSITESIPLPEVIDWLASLGAPLVIEFVTREDPMAQRLIAAKDGHIHPEYDRAGFERALTESFEVLQTEELPSRTRILSFARPRRLPGA